MDLEVKLKKIDQGQQNVISIRRNSFELDDADCTELTDLEEELEQCDVSASRIWRETRKNFELNQDHKNVPTFEQFIAFLEKREAVLLSVIRYCAVETNPFTKKPLNFSTKTKTLLVKQNIENKSCIICCEKNPHPIYLCPKFLELTPDKRFNLVRMHKLCELCLRKNHKKNECNSKYLCTCGLKHSKTICFRQTSERRKPYVSESVNNPTPSWGESEIKNKETELLGENKIPSALCSTVLNSLPRQKKKSVLLATGNIFLQNREGTLIKCTCIFDSASNINILSKKMSEILGIKLEKIQTSVSGLNSTKQNLKGRLNTLISNKNGNFMENVEFLVTEKITGLTPNVTLDISKMKIPKFMELSDPQFFEAKEIHALLNADVFFRIMKDNVYRVNEELLFRETEFGWIASGRLEEAKTNDVLGSCFLLNENSKEDTLKQFVKNRVQEITGLTNPNTWFHCPGKDNPSDFLSRGLSAKSLVCENKWWNGPSFLLSDELPETICECPEPDEKDYLPELKSENSNIVLTLNSNKTFFDYLINRSNRFLTIVRILSYLFRFMSNCRNQEKKKGPLTSEELSEAENYLLKQCQLEEFSAEVISLMSHNEISNKNEMHIKSYFDYKGENISGFSYISENAATSVMTFTINSISSSYKDVVHILPVNKIVADALHTFIKKLIIGLENIGFQVICVVTNNNSINQKAMSQFALPSRSYSIVYPHPVNNERPLFFHGQYCPFIEDYSQ
ncbi:hypothetical protein HNY73_009998 [Argiope bruennichi]|uniref:Transposable element P transposase-like RNase H domain-containing protein n=1 Tax=Argiope bruennichi TaxID=94029 RepID=A0A8T0F0E8_ARGBR|nr:hypothetical protein HNY73_009998 [Argiope bruennichi]